MKKDIIKRSDELGKMIANSPIDIDKSIVELTEASKRNRNLINWVIVSIVFETILAVAVVFAVVRSSQNTIRIEQVKNTQVSICLFENKSNANQLTFWNYILSISSSDEPMTPEQQERLDAFKDKLDDTFPQRDCDAL